MAKEVRDLLHKLNQIDIFDGRKVLKTDLTEPSPDFVQVIIGKFLFEFGFREDLMDTKRAFRFVEHLSEELILLASATKKFFQSIGFHDLTFGLLDLTQPNPQRIQQFLKHMVNFWVFSSQRAEVLNKIKDEAEAKAKLAKSIETDVKSKHKQLDEIRQAKEKMKIQKEAVNQEISELEKEIKVLSTKTNSLNVEYRAMKDQCQEVVEEEAKLDSVVEGLEKDERNVENLLKADQVKKNLESELADLREEHKNKMLDIQGVNKVLQEYKAKVCEFSMLHEELKNLEKVSDNIRRGQQQLEQKQMQLRDVREKTTEQSKAIVQMQSDLDTMKAERANKVECWRKKKECLVAEITDFRQELENVQKGKTRDEIVASDLVKQIANAEEQVKLLHKETAKTTQYYNDLFNTVFDAYVKFEGTFNRELEETVTRACEDLDRQSL